MTDSKHPIGFYEFDLGSFTNKFRGQTKKMYLDLKSDKYPGCQIYIYTNITVEKMPPPPPKNLATPGAGVPRGTIVANPATVNSEVAVVDPKLNALEKKRNELVTEVGRLEDQKNKLD